MASGKMNQNGGGQSEGQGEDGGRIRYLDQQLHVDVASTPGLPLKARDGWNGDNHYPRRFRGQDVSLRRRQRGHLH